MGRALARTCIQLVNMTHTDMSLEKTLSSSGLVSMQSFRQLSRKLVWCPSTSSMLEAYREHTQIDVCPGASALALRMSVLFPFKN